MIFKCAQPLFLLHFLTIQKVGWVLKKQTEFVASHLHFEHTIFFNGWGIARIAPERQYCSKHPALLLQELLRCTYFYAKMLNKIGNYYMINTIILKSLKWPCIFFNILLCTNKLFGQQTAPNKMLCVYINYLTRGVNFLSSPIGKFVKDSTGMWVLFPVYNLPHSDLTFASNLSTVSKPDLKEDRAPFRVHII